MMTMIIINHQSYNDDYHHQTPQTYDQIYADDLQNCERAVGRTAQVYESGQFLDDLDFWF